MPDFSAVLPRLDPYLFYPFLFILTHLIINFLSLPIWLLSFVSWPIWLLSLYPYHVTFLADAWLQCSFAKTWSLWQDWCSQNHTSGALMVMILMILERQIICKYFAPLWKTLSLTYSASTRRGQKCRRRSWVFKAFFLLPEGNLLLFGICPFLHRGSGGSGGFGGSWG